MTTQAARTEVASSRSFLLKSSALIMCVKKLFYCMSNMFDKCSHQLDFLPFLGLVSPPPLPPLSSLSPWRTLSSRQDPLSRVQLPDQFPLRVFDLPITTGTSRFSIHQHAPQTPCEARSHRVTPHRSRRLGVNQPLLPVIEQHGAGGNRSVNYSLSVSTAQDLPRRRPDGDWAGESVHVVPQLAHGTEAGLYHRLTYATPPLPSASAPSPPSSPLEELLTFPGGVGWKGDYT